MKTKPELSVYFTAGEPYLESTADQIQILFGAGVDMLEIGIPFSDPMADGIVIQQASERALHNGMKLTLLLQHLQRADLRQYKKPVYLMGYLNSVLAYGMERFCRDASAAGIAGVILPDLPFEYYKIHFEAYYQENKLEPVFLISEHSEDAKIRELDAHCRNSFLYVVSSRGATGSSGPLTNDTSDFLSKVSSMGLHSKLIAGFGISNASSFHAVCRKVDGAIIGSAYIQATRGASDRKALEQSATTFIDSILRPQLT